MKSVPASAAIALSLLASLGATDARAHDSSMSTCVASKVLLTAFDHRAPDAQSRFVELELTHGRTKFSGQLVVTTGEYAGAVKLASESGDRLFIGDVSLDYPKDTARVKGTIVLDGEFEELDSTLTCVDEN